MALASVKQTERTCNKTKKKKVGDETKVRRASLHAPDLSLSILIVFIGVDGQFGKLEMSETA